MRSIGNQGRQGMGKMYGVGEEGEIRKKWRAGLKRINISILCAMYARTHWGKCRKLGVETSAHSPRNRGFSCPKIRFERVEEG